ncbi:AraC family transcriptional regulator ligand-binding domain-containing protein [Thalassotalea psychrophila]|uniref:AraC family transcriptional regulator ligand-binding domain-containing protein n=1 Tax=Thalassotalea psychrophila TaxID=3065647 RepID=A0ABY9TZA9_9GAMM|nr:AraC family transcriptional regulator ligand-binding domain-containing protein [Colwelliaceae bacterium SQ149]
MKYVLPSIFLHPLKSLCIERYVDPSRILAQCNLPLSALHDTEMLIDHYAFSATLNTAANVMNEPLLGFYVGKQIQIAGVGFIGTLMTHQTMLMNVYPLLNYLFNAQERGTRHKLNISGKIASHYIEFLIEDKVDCHQLAQLALAGQHNIFKRIVGEQWQPTRVTFTSSKRIDVAQMQNYFNCPVLFNQKYDAIEFPAQILHQKLEPSLPINKSSKLKFAKLLHEFEDVAGLVSTFIESFLAQGYQDRINVAKSLGVHPRVLQSCLHERGVTYRGLVNRVRQKLAFELLAKTNLPITAIALQLGYNTASPFIRAFKQQQGITPDRWRHANLLN